MPTLFTQDTDVNVTFEDQQMINQFARTNARMQDTKEEVETKKVGSSLSVVFLNIHWFDYYI